MSRKVTENMISIKYNLTTIFYNNIEDENPCIVTRTYDSKTEAKQEMLKQTIEELTKMKSGIIKEDCTITWQGDDKEDYTERIVQVEIRK